MNTVGYFPSLYIISCYNQGYNLCTFRSKNDECRRGWRSIVRTHAFGCQQAQSVYHFSANISFIVQICWEEKKTFLFKSYVNIHAMFCFFLLSLFSILVLKYFGEEVIGSGSLCPSTFHL